MELFAINSYVNINIILLTDGGTKNIDNNHIIMTVGNGKILFMDSFIGDFYDISYYGDVCEIINNNRLSTDYQ